MPLCSQCGRPAIHGYSVKGGGQIALCLEHSLMYQEINERQLAQFERQMNFVADQADWITGLPRTGARYPPRDRPLQISGGVTLNHVQVEPGAIVGVVNAGGNIKSIDVSITSLGRQGDEQLAEAVTKLTEAIAKSPDVPTDQKSEALEILSGVAAEATQPKEQRRRFLVGPLLTRLAELATVGQALGQAWARYGPIITAAFQ